MYIVLWTWYMYRSVETSVRNKTIPLPSRKSSLEPALHGPSLLQLLTLSKTTHLVIYHYKKFHIYGSLQYEMGIFSFSTMPLRFIQVCAFLAYLLLLSSIPFKDILQFVYSFIHKEHLGCFQFQDVINKAIRAIYTGFCMHILHFPRVNTEKWNCS